MRLPKTFGGPEGPFGDRKCVQHKTLRNILVLLSLLLTPPAHGATAEHHILWTYGGGAIYRGYDAYAYVKSGWYAMSKFTADPAQDTLTVEEGHGLRPGDPVAFTSDGELPEPLTAKTLIQVKAVNANEVTLARAGYPVNIMTAGTGTHKIGKPIGAPADNLHLFVDSVTVPKGVTARLEYAARAAELNYSKIRGRYHTWAGAIPFLIRFRAAADADLGPGTATITLSMTGYPARRVSLPLEVRAAPAFTVTRPRRDGEPVPKALWKNTLINIGRKWCAPDNPYGNTYNFSNESQVWYYDGAGLYYGLAKLTGDKRWNACGDNISRQYQKWIANRGYVVEGWRTFARGLACSGDASLRDTVVKMVEAAGSPYVGANGNSAGGSVNDLLMRETALALDLQVVYAQITGKRPVHLQRSADFLLTVFYWLFEAEQGIEHQTFMSGMAMRSLINYWELTGDPRVPHAARMALDYIWAKAWNGSNIVGVPAPYGPQCLLGSLCQGYGTDQLGNAFWAPAFAWYWSVTGNDTYRVRADAMWEKMPHTPTATVTAAGDRWLLDEHGLTEGTRIGLMAPATGSLPVARSGIYHNARLYVRKPKPNSFQVSATIDGPIIDVTQDGAAGIFGPWGANLFAYPGGKQFAQIYWWTFDFLKYREGEEAR